MWLLVIAAPCTWKAQGLLQLAVQLSDLLAWAAHGIAVLPRVDLRARQALSHCRAAGGRSVLPHRGGPSAARHPDLVLERSRKFVLSDTCRPRCSAGATSAATWSFPKPRRPRARKGREGTALHVAYPSASVTDAAPASDHAQCSLCLMPITCLQGLRSPEQLARPSLSANRQRRRPPVRKA